MENHKGFIVLVDISGYTNFISSHNIDSSKNKKIEISMFVQNANSQDQSIMTRCEFVNHFDYLLYSRKCGDTHANVSYKIVKIGTWIEIDFWFSYRLYDLL